MLSQNKTNIVRVGETVADEFHIDDKYFFSATGKHLSSEHIMAVGGFFRSNNFLVNSIPVVVVSLSES